MKRFGNQWFFLIAVVFVALLLRILQLGEFPAGFHADEVRAGWNAYSILKTGQDDRGNRFPLYYDTFGDYRPTGIFYTIIPSIAIFGKSEFAVRLPSAVLGALTVIFAYFFALELTKKRHVALLSALLLAVSPWHINVSRATSETVIAVFLGLAAFYLLLRFLSDHNKKFLIASIALLALSYFFYHSIRLLAPPFVGMIVLYYWQKLPSIPRKLAVGGFVILSLLTLLFSFDKSARGRFSQVSIFNDLDVRHELSKMPFEEGPGRVFVARLFHNKPSVYARRFLDEYTRYFSPDFLIGSKQASPARYKTVGVGLLTYVEFFLVVAGLVAIARGGYSALPILLLLIAPLPAGLTTEDAPNLHRSLFMIPFLAIIGAYGWSYLTANKQLSRFARIGIPGLLALNLLFYFHMYYVHDKVHIPLYRNVGAKELAVKLNEIQNDYDQIVLTNIPDDPYPWIAFFSNRDPSIFNKDAVMRKEGVWATENFVFTGLRCPSRDAFKEPKVQRLLVVDAEGCASESNLKNRTDVKILTTIRRPDQSEVYTLWSKTE